MNSFSLSFIPLKSIMPTHGANMDFLIKLTAPEKTIKKENLLLFMIMVFH